jgi:hypothetical protein
MSAPGKSSVFGDCPLCLSKGCQLAHSHIIPEFAYQPCYDEKGRMVAVRTSGPKIESYLQKGLRQYLLCLPCEARLSKWEGHAKSVFENRIDLSNLDENGWTHVVTDYRLFKLYTMSLIWRMGVTTLPAFESVQLGAKHERILRDALMAGDPLAPHRYPTIICAVTISNEWLPDWITPPHRGDFQGIANYAGIIGGFLHSFFVNSRPVPRHQKPLALQADGVLKIPARNVREIPFLLKAIEEIQDARNKPGARILP